MIPPGKQILILVSLDTVKSLKLRERSPVKLYDSAGYYIGYVNFSVDKDDKDYTMFGFKGKNQDFHEHNKLFVEDKRYREITPHFVEKVPQPSTQTKLETKGILGFQIDHQPDVEMKDDQEDEGEMSEEEDEEGGGDMSDGEEEEEEGEEVF